MADEDEMLVALLDGELDEGRRASLLKRLEEDPVSRARYEALRDAGAPLGAAFEALLSQAPIAQLRRALPLEIPVRRRPGPFAGMALRDLAAGFVVGLLTAAAAAWLAFGLPASRDKDDWRSAVVDYMRLYTNETFAFPSPDHGTEAMQLSAVGSRVGADLTPEKVALPGLAFKVAFILSYEGAPLAELAYVDKTGAPILFCIIADKGADAPAKAETREALSLASWSRDGRGYLVIGGKPEHEVADFGRILAARF